MGNGAWRSMLKTALCGLMLLRAAPAQSHPLRTHPNPRRAERVRQLVRGDLAPQSDGGTQINGFDFWWIGARATEAVSSSGLQTILQQVSTPPKGRGCFSCWTSAYLDNDRWGQVGFSACNLPAASDVVTTFYQVWDVGTPPGKLLVDGESDVTAPGLHTYAMFVNSGTTWEFSVDGNTFGVADMGSSNMSSLPGAISTLCEEGTGVTAPFVPNPISAPVAMSVLQGGVWSAVPAGEIYNSTGLSGVVGSIQDSSLPADAVRIGGDAGTDDAGTPLWSGASGGFAPDAGPAGATPLAPPFLTFTSPSSGATVSGIVTLSGTIAFADGGEPITQVEFVIREADGGPLEEIPASGPPYTASWDTTQETDGVYDLAFGATDTLARLTFSYFKVTVKNPVGGTTGTSGGTTGAATTGTGSTGGSTTGSSGTSGGGTTGSQNETGASHGCSSTGDLGASFAALVAVAWLMRRRGPPLKK